MLYLEHFGLTEPPFRITPHTDFFFEGADRGATLDALLYAILHDEGIVKVSGEVGSGKTMLCKVLMERLPKHVEIVYLANPTLARDEILHAIADDLQVKYTDGRLVEMLRSLLDTLIDLYANGRRVVILIDEAHAMPAESLEQVRLLSNLESSQHKLLQIVMFGQPELDAMLDETSMRQLKDRITHSFRMRPLSEADVGKYISFRMRAAGYKGPDLFSPGATALIAKAARGLTRRVNILADKSLLSAYTKNTHAVTEREVRIAIRDSDFARLLDDKKRNPLLFAAATLFIGLALGVGGHWALSRNPAAGPSQGKDLGVVVPDITNAGVRNSVSPDSPPTQTAAGAVPSNPGSAPAPDPATIKQDPSLQSVVPSAGDIARGRNASAPSETSSNSPASGVTPTLRGPEGVQSAPLPPAVAPQPLFNTYSARRVEAYRVGNYNILKQRIAATLEKLEQVPDARFSIELFVTGNSDPARMQRFLIRARALVPIEDVYVMPQALGENYEIRVMFGNFPTREAAAKASKQLPAKYQQEFQLEFRSFAELRAAL